MSKKFGRCRICGENKDLSFEHVPPRVALNRTTRHISVPFDTWSKMENFLNYKPKGKILQGGIGYYSLCVECNNFLGSNYVPAYEKWVMSGLEAISNYNAAFIKYTALNQEPMKILKQIVSMFLAMNDDWYLEEYPELAEFVKNPLSQSLPDKFRVFTYLNNTGQFRYIQHTVFSQPELGIFNLSELTFPPFGYVLTFGFNKNISTLLDITNFMTAPTDSNHNLQLSLFNLETHLPFSPMDYRTKEKIEKDTQIGIQMKNNRDT